MKKLQIGRVQANKVISETILANQIVALVKFCTDPNALNFFSVMQKLNNISIKDLSD